MGGAVNRLAKTQSDPDGSDAKKLAGILCQWRRTFHVELLYCAVSTAGIGGKMPPLCALRGNSQLRMGGNRTCAGLSEPCSNHQSPANRDAVCRTFPFAFLFPSHGVGEICPLAC